MGDPCPSLHLDGQEGQQQLLPGIPDDLTLIRITTKLTWRALLVLPLVSRAWHRAVQSRQVYDARKQAHATETLVVPRYFGISVRLAMSQGPIQSKKDGTCRVLPGIGLPNERKTPATYAPDRLSGDELESSWGAHLASYDGKIYVLAGRILGRGLILVSTRVLVFDVAGHGQWTECASLRGNRALEVAGCVKDGNIYVPKANHVEAEVYDPELNVWSLTTPSMDEELERISLTTPQMVEEWGRLAV